MLANTYVSDSFLAVRLEVNVSLLALGGFSDLRSQPGQLDAASAVVTFAAWPFMPAAFSRSFHVTAQILSALIRDHRPQSARQHTGEVFRHRNLCDGGRLLRRLNNSLLSLPVWLQQLDLTHLLGQEFKAGAVLQHKHGLPEGPEMRGSHGELVQGPGNGADGPAAAPKPGLTVKLQQLQSAE